jgi:hypothetical protein
LTLNFEHQANKLTETMYMATNTLPHGLHGNIVACILELKIDIEERQDPDV